MTTELAVRGNGNGAGLARAANGLPTASDWETITGMAGALLASGLLPQHIKTWQAAAAVIQKGRELGLPPNNTCPLCLDACPCVACGTSGIAPPPLILRFWSNVEMRAGDCWEWKKGRIDRRYGSFKIGKKTVYAHRFAYVVAGGHLEPEQVVCHVCDNTLCCRPSHLFAGTQGDNLRDMSMKGRSTAGERNPQATLTQSQVDDIRNRYSFGRIYQRELAAEYGVTVNTVWRIIHRNRWNRGTNESA